MKDRAYFHIWDNGNLVPAYTRKPKNPKAKKLEIVTIQEKRLGVKWYIPFKREDE